MEKSNGHLGFFKEYEYFSFNGDVIKACISDPIASFAGTRLGMFFCTAQCWNDSAVCKRIRGE